MFKFLFTVFAMYVFIALILALADYQRKDNDNTYSQLFYARLFWYRDFIDAIKYAYGEVRRKGKTGEHDV